MLFQHFPPLNIEQLHLVQVLCQMTLFFRCAPPITASAILRQVSAQPGNHQTPILEGQSTYQGNYRMWLMSTGQSGGTYMVTYEAVRPSRTEDWMWEIQDIGRLPVTWI